MTKESPRKVTSKNPPGVDSKKFLDGDECLGRKKK